MRMAVDSAAKVGANPLPSTGNFRHGNCTIFATVVAVNFGNNLNLNLNLFESSGEAGAGELVRQGVRRETRDVSGDARPEDVRRVTIFS